MYPEVYIFSVMCDRCTDSSNREQLVLCIRVIDHGNLEPQEDVIGMYQIDDISAHTIVSVIRYMLVRLIKLLAVKMRRVMI